MINYLSLFSGIGAFEKAMNNLRIPFNLVGFSEIDKPATKSYCAIHNVSETLNLGDITKIDEKKLPKVDFITYGFPCQDISISGKMRGLFNNDGSKTRSGLFFDALRIIEHTQPIVVIAENVKNLTSKKFNAQFQVVLASLESAGYNNYWAVLDAKDYGVPHQRGRVFIVSIRKDVDTKIFEFPKPYPLKKHLIDLLDLNVADDIFLTTDRANNLVKNLLENRYEDKIQNKINVIGDLWADNGHKSMAGRVYEIHGISPTLGASHFQQVKYIFDPNKKKIRPLTPMEAFRLSGFTDDDFRAASTYNSKTQLLKQAGNTIVVDVAEELLCMLFDEDGKFFI